MRARTHANGQWCQCARGYQRASDGGIHGGRRTDAAGHLWRVLHAACCIRVARQECRAIDEQKGEQEDEEEDQSPEQKQLELQLSASSFLHSRSAMTPACVAHACTPANPLARTPIHVQAHTQRTRASMHTQTPMHAHTTCTHTT